jgi:ATP synthase F1 complex assembly factor 1
MILSNLAKRNFAFSYPCPRKLREIVKYSLFEKETPQTIEQIWTEYHRAKSYSASRILPTSLYMQLMSK